ncbi:MAG: hypothetical protein A2Z06_03360 [Candidatus Glassbacteria bacterium RBG_16_58_8]|uniref:Cell division protein ZapA n=1 Tax=Candidatus Glassbacteria bacterium RBG_16_58_8 TaxID=1817866 RepID=A0A1F5YC16_9BACT|nr:MAG: hypothetical protein A2Z06_03360 [Candidatus Glassbacteria bacterium RBG_16_58_8]
MDGRAGKTTKVNIFGEELGIKSEASAEYTRQVAEYVDQAMKQVAKTTHLTDIHRIAILAAMSITNEYFQAREQACQVEKQWESQVGEILRTLKKVGEGVNGEAP